MRHWKLYEEKGEDLLNDDGDDNDGCNNTSKRQKSNNVIFRYDWLIGDDMVMTTVMYLQMTISVMEPENEPQHYQ